MSDLEKTIHYTTESEKICNNLLSYIPYGVKLVEPFVGGGDLKRLLPTFDWETYDIDSSTMADYYQDTLINPPDYRNKWVITNSPFLAKNKAEDKIIYDKYKVDDLYKAFLISMLEAEGGIVILPTNFLADEKSKDVRKRFFNIFEILELNIFTVPVFSSTTYSVCSFAFKKKEKEDIRICNCNIFPGTKKL